MKQLNIIVYLICAIISVGCATPRPIDFKQVREEDKETYLRWKGAARQTKECKYYALNHLVLYMEQGMPYLEAFKRADRELAAREAAGLRDPAHCRNVSFFDNTGGGSSVSSERVGNNIITRRGNTVIHSIHLK